MKSKTKNWLKKLGPGFITGAADDDPSGIATYTQSGAQFGFNQIWLMFLVSPFVIVIQKMCGRIGMVTGQGLSGVIREHYSKKILFGVVALLVLANAVNIGADLGAMAAAIGLLVPISFPILIISITVFTLILEVFVSYKVYVKYLKYFALTLFAYLGVLFFLQLDWEAVVARIVTPHITWSKDYLFAVIALLGTTISPYLFFWQTGEEVEELISEKKLKAFGDGKPKTTEKDFKEMQGDTVRGMVFSNLVAVAIMIAAAATLLPQGITQIDTAAQAAEALAPIAGKWAQLLFTIGIIGVGLLAVPVLAGSASYAVSEALNLKEGLYRKFSQAHGFYGIITIATLLGLLINFTSIPPFRMLYYTAILNGAISPILMILIVRISSNKTIMGEHVNTRYDKTVGWFITVLMSLCSVLLVYFLLT